MTIKQSISKGEELRVDAVVHNIGKNSGTETVELVVNGTTVDSSSVSLNSDEEKVIQLIWDTTGRVPDIYELKLDTNDNTAVRNIIITGSWLDVSNLTTYSITTDGPVTAGQTLTAEADVTNIGRADVTDDIEFRVDNNTLDSTNVTLDIQESESLLFFWDTSTGDGGDHTVEISSTDDTETASVTVEALTVEITGTNSPVSPGNTLDVTATIENTYDTEQTQVVSLDAGALGSDSTSVTLSARASTSVTLSVGTSDGDAGDYTATVESENGTASQTVTVAARGEFTVTLDTLNVVEAP